MLMKSSLKRETKETKIEVCLDLDGSGICNVDTGIKLLDGFLTRCAISGSFDLAVKAKGDLETGDHHTVEDVGITLGSAIARLKTKGTGSAIVPSADGLALAAISFGEPGYTHDFSFKARESDGMALENFSHFLRALAYNGQFTLYLSAKGDGDRPKIDTIASALGRAIKKAHLDGKICA
jgi:imidazoleglycerol-phosphate dehydratase